ncbi:MAG: histidine phosphatase family protein [Anaerolineae bacterium]
MNVERVLLIRHAETDWNAQGRWQGHEPVPLSEKGRAQARKLAEHLSTRPIGSVYTSDLPRALETATALAEALGVDPFLDKRLREWHLGIFQGLTRSEILEKYPTEFEENRQDYFDYVIPSGESRRQLQARVYEAWQQIIKDGVGPEIALVSHGGTLKMLLLKLFESDAPALREIHIDNTSITTIERHANYWRIVGLAATPHLIT